jgi:hypothetical protein
MSRETVLRVLRSVAYAVALALMIAAAVLSASGSTRFIYIAF